MNLEERFKALQVKAAEMKVNMQLSINDTYGMFCIYFDPGHQGLDPIPQVMARSLDEALCLAEVHMGIAQVVQTIAEGAGIQLDPGYQVRPLDAALTRELCESFIEKNKDRQDQGIGRGLINPSWDVIP